MITTMLSDQNCPPPRVEVITSVERRRRWPTAEKIRLVEETMQPGMSVSYVARRAGVAPSRGFQCLNGTEKIVVCASSCTSKAV
jgi:transposase